MLRSVLLDYNPIVNLYIKLISKVGILADFADYVRSLLFNKDDQVLEKILFLIGVTALTFKTAAFVKKTLSSWSWVPSHIINNQSLNASALKHRYGDCFVAITGFTEGIGRGYAQIFAQLGFNLLLIGIDKPTVQLKVAELSKIYKKIRILSIVADLSNLTDLQQLQSNFNRLGDIDIGIVVNNAGTLSRGAYIEIDPAGLTRDIKVDLLAIFVINRFMVPRLRARAHRSAIINMASCTGVYLSHRIGVYSSGKKTVDIYSRILAIENKDKIDVLSARPFGVATRMMKMKKGPFMVTPRQCVVSIIADLLGGQTTTFSHLQHKVCSTLGFVSLTERQIFNLYEKTYVETGFRNE